MSNLLEIELNFNRRYFEEIYFKNNSSSYIKNDKTKTPFWCMVISVLPFLYYGYYSWYVGPFNYLSIVIGIFFIYNSFLFVKNAMDIRSFRVSVKKHLDMQEQFGSHKLVLTENVLQVVLDSTEHIEQWNRFREVQIDEDRIFIDATNTNFLFPKKCMSEDSYKLLCNIISDKVK